MACDEKGFEPQGPHDSDLVVRHEGFGICPVNRGLKAVSVATQIGDHDREVLAKSLGDLLPYRMGLRIAMQQQRRPRSTSAHKDLSATDINGRRRKAGEKLLAFSTQCSIAVLPRSPVLRLGAFVSVHRLSVSRGCNSTSDLRYARLCVVTDAFGLTEVTAVKAHQPDDRQNRRSEDKHRDGPSAVLRKHCGRK